MVIFDILDLRFVFPETKIGLEPILNVLALFLLTPFASCSPNRKYDAYATFSARRSRFLVSPRDCVFSSSRAAAGSDTPKWCFRWARHPFLSFRKKRALHPKSSKSQAPIVGWFHEEFNKNDPKGARPK